MSKNLPIDLSTLLPIKEAAKRIGYSRDYVARLAREGKISGRQVGRQWYVDFNSLNAYSCNSIFLEELQKKILSEERKHEREIAEQLSVVKSRSLDFVSNERASAVLSSLAVLLVGVVTGSMVYSLGLFYVPVSPTVSVASLSQASLPGAALPDARLQTLETPSPTLLYVDENDLMRDEIVELDAAFGVLLLARGRSGSDDRTVADLFSDPVAVTFDSSTGGVVRYEKGNGEAVELPFVQVPSESPLLNE